LLELGDASGKLADGVAQLLSDASTFQNFDKEGIQKLKKLGGDDLKNLSKRIG